MQADAPKPRAKRHVLVTGGTRGLGQAIAWQLAREGAHVTSIYARNDRAAEAVKAAAVAEQLSLDVLRADLTTGKGLEAVQACVLCHEDQHPSTVLSLVHAAATGVHRSVDSLTARHWDWTQALNVRAMFELVRLLHDKFVNGSAILAVSSAGAVRAVPAYAAVGASKGALEAFTRHLAVEMAPRGVRVNILSPGSVDTQAWLSFPDHEARMAHAVAQSPIGRLVTAQEVANVAAFLLSPAAGGMVGQTVVVDGGARLVEP